MDVPMAEPSPFVYGHFRTGQAKISTDIVLARIKRHRYLPGKRTILAKRISKITCVKRFIFMVENDDVVYGHSAKYYGGIGYILIFKNR